MKMSGAAAHPNGSRTVIWMSTSGPPTSRSPIRRLLHARGRIQISRCASGRQWRVPERLEHLQAAPPANGRAALGRHAYDITDATMVEAPTDAIYQQLQQSLYQRRRLDRSMVWTAEAPDAPQSNWIQTVDGRNFLVAFRLYGTGVEFFDQTWKPGDLLRIGSGGRASQ
jgi:hypothetical protein